MVIAMNSACASILFPMYASARHNIVEIGVPQGGPSQVGHLPGQLGNGDAAVRAAEQKGKQLTQR